MCRNHNYFLQKCRKISYRMPQQYKFDHSSVVNLFTVDTTRKFSYTSVIPGALEPYGGGGGGGGGAASSPPAALSNFDGVSA